MTPPLPCYVPADTTSCFVTGDHLTGCSRRDCRGCTPCPRHTHRKEPRA